MASDTVDADPSVWMPIAQMAKEIMDPPVSRQALSKRVAAFEAAGQLATKPGPRGTKLVNVVALQRLIKSETDPAQALRNGRPEPELPLAEDDEPAKSGAGDDGSYSNSRARRESFQAENARLDLEERLGKLVSVSEVERRLMDLQRRLRDRLLGLPGLIAPEDAEFRARADTEIRKLLDRLADELSDIAGADSELDSSDDDEPGGAE